MRERGRGNKLKERTATAAAIKPDSNEMKERDREGEREENIYLKFFARCVVFITTKLFCLLTHSLIWPFFFLPFLLIPLQL